MTENNQGAAGGGCTGALAVLLTVAFVVLKLCKVIAWSWWWVISPILIYIGIIIILVIIYLIVYVVTAKKAKQRYKDLFK